MKLGTHRSRTATKVYKGLKREDCAPFDTTATSHGEIRNRAQASRCPSGTPAEDDLSRTAKYLQLNSVFTGAVNT